MSQATAPIRHTDRFYIGGEWVAPSSDAKTRVIDSDTEELYFTVPEARAADISRAVGAARRGAPRRGARSVRQRPVAVADARAAGGVPAGDRHGTEAADRRHRPDLTPETYLGADREQFYGGGSAYVTGRFASPATLPPDSFGLAGDWTIGQQSITAGKDAGITLAFHASYVYLDVGGTGTLTVSVNGTSKVIRVFGAPDIYTVATEQPARSGTVAIRLSPGLAAYSFTFG